ncbi:MAG: hypothetical protein C0506_04235 [Anaerolinea sp.]|nr:hypothetical protein [Anaerolinea sp.]
MTSHTMNVVFGTGPVGLAVIDELAGQGERVRAVNRSGRAALPDGVELAPGDATDGAFTASVCGDAAVIYNCLNAPYAKWPEQFPPLQAGVLAAAEQSGAKLVVMENVYMYGPTGGKPLTEDLPYLATTRKGRCRAEMAQSLLDAHRSGRARVAIGRASDFFGPRARESAVGERVFGVAVRGKKVQVLGDPDAPHTYTYVPDIARGLVTLGTDDRALGSAWHLPSAPAISTREFVKIAFEAAGKPLKMQRVSKPMLKLAGLFSPAVRELDEMLYEFEEPFIVDNSRFTTTFGQEATTLAEAIATTVDWFNANRK